MSQPEYFDLTPEQIEALLARVEASTLEENDAELIGRIVETLRYLYQVIDDKNVSMQRLRRMLFGDTTEKTRQVLKRLEKVLSDAETSSPPASESPESEPGAEQKKKKKRKGHGRNGYKAYTGAKRVKVPHSTLKTGSTCPGCGRGRLFDLSTPGTLVRCLAQPPVQATVFEMQKLRCSACQAVFTAEPPAGVGNAKYDATVVSMIACLKYGSGMPFKRIETLQKNMGVPLPASTQWELVAPAVDRLYPAYEVLLREAAQGQVVHNDDTTMKILSLMKRHKDKHELDSTVTKKQKRSGIFTTGIVSKVDGRDVALFFTGRKHAGENLEDVLKRRVTELGPPIQMCDALSRNKPGEFAVILANCLSHGRRRFVDVAGNFPEECLFVLKMLGRVYQHDAKAKKQGLLPEERLHYHQKHSKPLMKKLHEWMKAQFDEKLVEKNSGLGEAITYMMNHWQALTLFLKQPGAPLDNNLCERALKKAILHRKNAMFYRTENGARVGDIFMSLIHTCELCRANPFKYLTALQKNALEVAREPEKWMPWNYQEVLRANDDYG